MVIDKLREIEEKFRTNEILLNNEFAWRIIRPYVAGLLYEKEDGFKRNQRISVKHILTFIYGFPKGLFKILFGQYEMLFFSKSERRKKINGIYHDRVLEGAISLLESHSLLIESPVPVPHYPSKITATKNLASESLFYLVQGAVMIFIRNKVVGEEVIHEIEEKYNIRINYQQIFKRFRAQYISMLWFLSLKKIKGSCFVAPSLYLGYVKALKEKNIPVIEFQHGIINDQHYAYNFFDNTESSHLPDYLLTYGNAINDLLSKSNGFIVPKNIIAAGNYYLEKLSEHAINNSNFKELKEKYELTVAFSGQENFEEDILNFIIESSYLDLDILYVYVPRETKSYNNYNLPKNVVIVEWLNVYEAIILCDFHSTMTSSCAIEAPVLGKQNILLDLYNQASKYYGELLDNEKVTKYATTPQEFVEAVRSMPKVDISEIKNSIANIFKPNHLLNITSFFKYLKLMPND